MTIRCAWAGAAAAVALLCGAAPASAQFYAGKTLTMVINYPPGGPTDIEGRIVGRHIANHIPGKPAVVVKNQPGGAGNIAANALGLQTPKDGLTLGFFTWNPLDQILSAEGLAVKYQDFVFIAGIQQPVVVYARKDTPPGLAKPEDIVKASGFKAGALAPNTHGTLRMGFALDLLGVKYRLVSGYKGLKEVETAVHQNEVQLSNSSLPGFRASITPTMVATGIVIPLFHFDIEESPGVFKPSPALPDVVTFLDLYKRIHGADKMPSGPKWEAMVLINGLVDSMFRTVFLPPGSPKEAAAVLKSAFAALWRDEAFLADYEKSVRNRPGLVVGEAGEKIIARLSAVKPEMVKFINDYVAAAGQ
jgi:tripartite-type tricarboxylate transporter receptor subunit TctC